MTDPLMPGPHHPDWENDRANPSFKEIQSAMEEMETARKEGGSFSTDGLTRLAQRLVGQVAKELKAKKSGETEPVPSSQAELFCRDCGAKLAEGDRFCHACGKSVPGC